MIRQFFIPGQPQGKGRAKVTTRGKFAHAYTPEKTTIYENYIRQEYTAKHSTEPLLQGEIMIAIDAWFQIPKSASKKQAERMRNHEIRPTTKPDWDNISKVICDALNGIAWGDDSAIVSGIVDKWYADTPGVMVTIKHKEV